MKPRTRRSRSPHPGLVLLRPDPKGRHPHWRARYVDPDTGRTVKTTIEHLAAPTAEARRDWAIRKAKALARRRAELDAGAHPTTGTSLADSLKRYFEDHERLRPATIEAYKAATDKLLAWATKAGVRSADDLTAPRLVAFRADVLKERRRVHVKGGKRGAVRTTTEPRSPYTVNRELRSVRTVLGYLRKLALLPRLNGDDLRDALQRLAVTTERIDYRKPVELQKLLEAALRHDAATFDATREEHAGRRSPGTTQRYEPVAPFVATAMLTGMRLGELVSLDWKQVDLDAIDNEGRAVGEVHLTGATKTKRARTIGLEVSPALRKMLAALHLKSGGKGSVFGLTEDAAQAAARRLRDEYGAPGECGWQALRRTCGTYLTNSSGIFGASSAYRSAKQLGHSVAIAEKHYLGLVRGIPRDARTLEAAMQVEAQMKSVIEAVGVRPAARKSA